MRFIPLVLCLSVLCAPTQAQETRRYRQWLAGQEVGGLEETETRAVGETRIESREWTRLDRLGMVLEQESRQAAVKAADGSLRFAWSLTLSKEPFQGEASWSPRQPTVLEVRAKGAAIRQEPVQASDVLWPGDQEARLRQAARSRTPVKFRSYGFATQGWGELDLKPDGPEPLPGFPDAVRFQGTQVEGGFKVQATLWISPKEGSLKLKGSLMGLDMLLQRAELPAPGASASPVGFFRSTLKPLPSHPFMMWLPQVLVRWEGKAPPPLLPEDPQQRSLGEGRIRLRTAEAPSASETAQPPVTGKPFAEDLPFLAATSLVQHQDPAFEALVKRMDLPKEASRWELARRVTGFVNRWIRQKDYTVGFASALEVCRDARGDCTEHGVLAVALLRRLGVPARGVTGWVALDRTLGLHFWAEVKLGQRWIPIDPTFDQAPASAFRLKLGTTDLADLASVGWDSAALSFGEGGWVPEGAPWSRDVRVEGATVLFAGGYLRLPGGRWAFEKGDLRLAFRGQWHAATTLRPPESQRLVRYAGAKGRTCLWDPGARAAHLDLGEGRWLRLEALDAEASEGGAVAILDALELGA
ncbi:MAG: transglutaminase domain-containing protein [Holophagaceae bacterium]|nr:transglutaminase domain-containing protein [Holophagaceae bacterium]